MHCGGAPVGDDLLHRHGLLIEGRGKRPCALRRVGVLNEDAEIAEEPLAGKGKEVGEPGLAAPEGLEGAAAAERVEAARVGLPHLEVVPETDEADPKPRLRGGHPRALHPLWPLLGGDAKHALVVWVACKGLVEHLGLARLEGEGPELQVDLRLHSRGCRQAEPLQEVLGLGSEAAWIDHLGVRAEPPATGGHAERPPTPRRHRLGEVPEAALAGEDADDRLHGRVAHAVVLPEPLEDRRAVALEEGEHLHLVDLELLVEITVLRLPRPLLLGRPRSGLRLEAKVVGEEDLA
mmetsp:Transcript_28360/g.67465  ORF Transcript_28360/g.67465 Transcript_28360/m.67465 type:complete len:292 (-) Transcript_28360:4835-5710(-)